jgi:hypothetical protein
MLVVRTGSVTCNINMNARDEIAMERIFFPIYRYTSAQNFQIPVLPGTITHLKW